MKKTLPIRLLLIVFLSMSAFASPIKYRINFCQFEIPEILKRANASFNVIGMFTLDKDGNPQNISIVKSSANKFVEPDQIIECIQSWKITGVQEGDKVTAYWRWEHANGWIPLRISGEKFELEIEVSGDPCPYRN